MVTTIRSGAVRRAAVRPVPGARRTTVDLRDEPVGSATRRGPTGTGAVAAPAMRRSTGRRGTSSSRYVLVTLLVVLNLVGLVMVLSSSSVLSINQFGNPWHYFERQLIWLVIGASAFVVAVKVDVRKLRRLARPLMAVTVLLLVAVLVPGVGVSAAGASRWIGTSSLQIQPSEFAKLTFILFIADVLDRRAERGERGDWLYQMGPVLFVLAVIGALVIRQPDMGTTLVLALIALAMIFTAGLPMKPLGAMLLGGTFLSLLLALAAPYRWRRMTSFLHPLAHQSDTGYQAAQGLAALYSGHLFGDGIGASTAAYGYLPNAQTDYIFAIIGEETGLVGTLLLSGLFVGLGLVGIRIAAGAKDRFSGLLAAGITAWLAGQAVINIGAVVGLLPVTGVPLPFVSFGGSSLVIALFAAGLLAGVARRS